MYIKTQSRVCISLITRILFNILFVICPVSRRHRHRRHHHVSRGGGECTQNAGSSAFSIQFITLP